MPRALNSIRESRFAALLVVVTAVVTATLSCAAHVAAANDSAGTPQKLDLTYVPEDAVAAIVIQPKRLLTGPQFEKFPSQMFGFIKSGLGFELKDVDQAMFLVGLPDPAFGPENPNPKFAAIVNFAASVDTASLPTKVSPEGEDTTLEGKKARIDSKLARLSCIVLDDHTLLVSSLPNLRWLLTANKNADSSLCKLLAGADTAPECQVVLAVAPIRPLIQKGLSQKRKLPPALQSLTRIPLLADTVVATATKTPTGGMQIKITANTASEQSASELEQSIKQALEMARTLVEAQIKNAPPGKVPPGVVEASNKFIASLQLNRIESRVEIQTEVQSAPAAIGFVTAMVIPAVQAAREAANRNMSQNNLKQIALCMLNYEVLNKRLPAQAIYSKDGKPLLSWRVQMLPQMEEQELYDQFHLDEPWDSEHNKKLVEKMPGGYRDARANLPPGMTIYEAVVGPHCAFEGKEGVRLASFTDGLSKTIAVVEVASDKAVPWTKPQDWELDPKDPLKGLANYPGEIFNAMFMDGHIQTINRSVDPTVLNALFTRNGGERVDLWSVP